MKDLLEVIEIVREKQRIEAHIRVLLEGGEKIKARIIKIMIILKIVSIQKAN